LQIARFPIAQFSHTVSESDLKLFKKINRKAEEAKMGPQTKFVSIHNFCLGPDVLQADYDKASKMAVLVKKYGLIEPLAVKQTDDGYLVVLGKIRLLAAVLAELESIPVMVIDYDNYGRQSDIALYIRLKLRLLNLHSIEHGRHESVNLPKRNAKKSII
jgi:hypothetical protein